MEDISWGPISVELKTREEIPAYVKMWMKQAKRNSEGKIPVVVWHEDRMGMGKQLAILTLDDFRALVELAYGKGTDASTNTQ